MRGYLETLPGIKREAAGHTGKKGKKKSQRGGEGEREGEGLRAATSAVTSVEEAARGESKGRTAATAAESIFQPPLRQ